MRKVFWLVAALAAGLLPAMPACAQEDWPVRPVTIVIPATPGAGTDLFARLLADTLSASLKQQFLVENKAGAGGNIAAVSVARSAPTGYTLLVSPTGVVAVNPSLYKNPPFDTQRDFVPIARGVTAPFVFLAHPALPANTLAELVALGKSQPGKITFGAVGMGSLTYLAVRLLEEASGARFLFVPYKGMGQAYQDLLSGQINFVHVDVGSALGHIKAGKAKPLATSQKTALLPGTPSVAEAGFANVEVTNSFSVLAPAGTPPAVVSRLARQIRRAMQSPAFAARLEAQALTPVLDTPQEFAASLRKESDAWAEFIRRTGIVLEQ